MSLSDTNQPPSDIQPSERIRVLESAVLDLLARVQHLEAEAANRRFMGALAKMKAVA
jgi:hypothetical protein